MVPPNKWEIGYLIDYLAGQVRDLGVNVIVNKEADCKSVIDAGADVVIVATGSTPCGILSQEAAEVEMITSLDLLGGCKIVGENVVVIGGGAIGCEISNMLAAEGKKVRMLEMMDKAGMDIGPTERFIVMSTLKQRGVEVETATRAVKVIREGVVVEKDGSTGIFKADAVVVATGMQPDNGLSRGLSGTAQEFYAIGDCAEPKRIGEAVKSAFRTAIRI